MTPRITYFIIVLNFIGLVSLSVYTVTTRQKLVYVDANFLVSNYKGMQLARAEYQKKMSKWKSNIDTLAKEYQQKLAAFEKGKSHLSTKEVLLSRELLEVKQKQLVEYQRALELQAQQEDQKLTKEVLAKINLFIKQYGESNNYSIVMAATEYGNIAYADDGLDITKVVLEKMNLEYIN